MAERLRPTRRSALAALVVLGALVSLTALFALPRASDDLLPLDMLLGAPAVSASLLSGILGAALRFPRALALVTLVTSPLALVALGFSGASAAAVALVVLGTALIAGASLAALRPERETA